MIIGKIDPKLVDKFYLKGYRNKAKSRYYYYKGVEFYTDLCLIKSKEEAIGEAKRVYNNSIMFADGSKPPALVRRTTKGYLVYSANTVANARKMNAKGSVFNGAFS